MDRYLALQVFQQVAALESFAAAGRRLGLSAPAVSKNIAALEAHLGVRLINRSTRRMALTDEGRIYLAHVSRGLEALADGELALDPLRQQPRGTLRVAAPLSVTLSRLSARVPDFLARHPSLRLELDLDDRRVDLIREGFDLALRGSDRLEDSSLVARKLVDLPHVLCASPAYLQRHGTPTTPAELAAHSLIRFSLSGHADTWVFRPGGSAADPSSHGAGVADGRMGPSGATSLQAEVGMARTPAVQGRQPAAPHAVTAASEVRVPVDARYSVSSSLAVRDALRAGLGVSLIPRLYVEDDLRTGQLQALLPEWESVGTTLYVIYPSRQYLSLKVRAFVEFLREVFV